MCGKDEVVIGAGFIHPKSKMREAFKAEQLAELGAEAAAEYLRRLEGAGTRYRTDDSGQTDVAMPENVWNNLGTQERIVRGRMPTMELINERFAVTCALATAILTPGWKKILTIPTPA